MEILAQALALTANQAVASEPAEVGYPGLGLAAFVALGSLLTLYRRRLSLAVHWIVAVVGMLAALSLSSSMETSERALVFIILVILASIALLQQRRPILQYLFFCRVPLTIGLLLFALPSIALGPMRSLFRNLFVTRPGGVFLISLLSFLSAWVVLLTVRLTAGGAAARFCTTWNADGSPVRPGPRGSLIQLALSGVLALPTVGTVVALSPESGVIGQPPPTIAVSLLFAFLGMTTALFLFYFAYLLGRYLSPPDSSAAEWELLPLPLPRELIKRISGKRIERIVVRLGRLEQSIASLGEDVSAGYLDEARHLRPGLRLATSFAAVTFLFYAACYFLLHPDDPIDLPPLANVLFLIILLGWILPCLSFFLDRFRVPLVVFLASVTFLLYFISDIDHYYLLNSSSDNPTANQSVTVNPMEKDDESTKKEVSPFLSNRQKVWAANHPNREPILIAVAASGGGITASVWTAKVLAELQREFGAEFSESIYGLSTVSGGSVGAMYFIDAFRNSRAPTEASLSRMISDAGTSSLAATAWGLAYPDFWRGFSLQNPFRPYFDRAWAMEQVWRRTLRPDGSEVPTLKAWRVDVRAGRRPAAFFNATIVETGERLVLSPLKITPQTGGCGTEDSTFEDCVEAQTFSRLYAEKDLPVTTAARLSATFPFVSPITRPRLKNNEKVANPYHVADGGYYDNYGVVSLVEGLRRVLSIHGKQVKPRKILVVEIRASDSIEAKVAKRRAGWAFGTAGPMLTLLNVWGSGQTPRNDLDLQLLKEVAEKRGFELETVLFPLVSDAPLSWHLTAQQMEHDILRSWDWCEAMPAFEGKQSKIQVGLEKARAFLTKAGWTNLPPNHHSQLSKEDSEKAQIHCRVKPPDSVRESPVPVASAIQ